MNKKDYRSIPFWSWNDKLEKSKLIDQIHWMNDNGIGGFFMHARSGLQTDYLSEDWMQCIDACADEAKKLDMKAWIYDENGWPSGFVGGKLLEDEKNRDKYITVEEGAYDQNATASYRITENELLRIKQEDSVEEKGTYLNLYIHTAVSTADILNPEVVDKFLALTHQQYKERYGEKFADYIEGFFTDEPQYQRWDTPYTDVVATYWEEQYGEDILDGLGLLFVEKEGYRSFRYRYWKAMQHLMLENFAKRVYTWCDDNGVKLTGHYVEESTMGCQLMCCGGVMPFYEYEHIPGIDWLGKWTDRPLAAKQVGSVAAQLGKKQVLTETFGCCGWDVKPSELRRIASFQYVNGVNMMCHHLIPYSERGNRKYDYPAHYSTVNPWVKENFKEFNDYYTELGHFLGEGEQHVNVAMLHPIRSAYFDYKRELENKGFGVVDLDNQLHGACKLLASRGIEYHFLDETLLAKYGFVEGNRIGCGKCAYDYLILPTMLTMDATTEQLVRQFVEQGGKILMLGEKPAYLEADEFNYDYLVSNVTLEEICAAQTYNVSDFDTDIFSTYRVSDGKEYLYVMNSSDSKTQSQTFHFKSNGKETTVTLKPGEDAMLCATDEVQVKKELTPFVMKFADADIAVKENYLVVDSACYSKDGKEFSKPWPIPALFNKLLQEQYCGEIYLRYEFEVGTLPEKIYLRAEKSNDIAAWLNGECLTDVLPGEEDYILYYDVTDHVQLGSNEYTVKVNWYENDNVFFALFGENVTESLKNCIVYDTELQPIELVGKFGVYSKTGYASDEDIRFVQGNDFYIGEMPKSMKQEPVTEGFPFLAGEMVLKQKVVFDTTDILLQVAGEYHMAFVKVNGVDAGTLFFDTELDISHVAKTGENEIEIRFILSNRNRMGPHHIMANGRDSVSPWSFELSGHWEEDTSKFYYPQYDLKKFYS